MTKARSTFAGYCSLLLACMNLIIGVSCAVVVLFKPAGGAPILQQPKVKVGVLHWPWRLENVAALPAQIHGLSGTNRSMKCHVRYAIAFCELGMLRMAPFPDKNLTFCCASTCRSPPTGNSLE